MEPIFKYSIWTHIHTRTHTHTLSLPFLFVSLIASHTPNIDPQKNDVFNEGCREEKTEKNR